MRSVAAQASFAGPVPSQARICRAVDRLTREMIWAYPYPIGFLILLAFRRAGFDSPLIRPPFNFLQLILSFLLFGLIPDVLISLRQIGISHPIPRREGLGRAASLGGVHLHCFLQACASQ